jgi:hypothetical protein
MEVSSLSNVQAADYLTELVTATAWILGAVFIGALANGRRRNGSLWFVLGVLVSPLVALIVLLALGSPNLTTTGSRASPARRHAVILGDGAFRFPIVGESHYQAELEEIAGGRSEDGARNLLVEAILVREPTNPYDPSAIAVKVEDRIVGYLSRDSAKLFDRALIQGGFETVSCEAVINGGWDRGPSDRGHFGVRLNAALPFRLQAV